jgi:glycosyltransferase involved in cell wall biosynthesis
MRVAIVSGKDVAQVRDTDGGAVLIQNLARELRRRGDTIDVYTPENIAGGAIRDRRRSAPESALPYVSIIRFTLPEEGLGRQVPDPRPGSYFLDRMVVGERIGEYFEDRKLHAYDRIYVFHMANAFGLVTNGRCPLERTVLFPMFLGAFYRLFDTVPESYLRAERETLLRLRHISTPSEAERAVLMQTYGVPSEKIFITQRGYDESIFTPHLHLALPETDVHLVSANVIKPQKNQQFFVALAAAARDRIPGLVIHLAGIGEMNARTAYGQYAHDLKRAIAQEGLDRHFVFHDVLSQHALHDLMRGSHLALYPSLTETFGKSVLESIVSGLPTIACKDVPAYAAFLEDRQTGIAIDRSVAAALEAIEMLRADAALYRSLSANGIARAPRFTWTRVTADFIRDSEARMRAHGSGCADTRGDV